MKTKHIFYSMALAAVLGACSSENLEVAETNTQDLSIRPLVGDVELTVGSAQTRFATGVGAQPVFKAGDKLGACIIDVPNYGGGYDPAKPAIGQYKIVEYYSSNNAFTYDGSIWKVDQPLVEGSYLFYAPYSNKMQARTPLSIKVPVKQTATSEKAALDEFYASGAVVRVGYQFLAAKGGEAQRPKVTMNDVFAYPLFTIKNNFKGLLDGTAVSGAITTYAGGEITLDSIQISQCVTTTAVAATVTCGGVLKHAQSNVVATAATEGIVGMMKPEGAWATSPMVNYTTDLLSTKITNNDASDGTNRDRTAGVITTLVCNKEIAAGGEFKVYGVLPAMKYTNSTNSLRATLFVTIAGKHYSIEDATVTNSNGTYTATAQKGGILITSLTGEVTLIKGQKFPQEELNFEQNKLTPKPSAGNILTIDLTGGFGTTGSGKKAQIATEFDTSTPAPVTKIKTNEEFVAFFKGQLNGSALTEGATISGPTYCLADDNTLVLNSALIEALFTYNNKGTLTINTALPIDKDVTITAVSGTDVTFKSANGKSYTIELGNNYITSGATITVSSGDTKTVIINADCTTFANAGTIKTLYVVEGKSLTLSAATTMTGNIINDGTLTTGTNALTPGSLVNREGATLSVSATIANQIENNGTITIAATTANITVSAGIGTINVPATYAAAKIAANATQTGIYVKADAIDNTVIKAADALSWCNAISGTTATLNKEALSEIKDIKAIILSGNIATSETATLDFKNLTIKPSAAITWTGNGLTNTIINNVNIVSNETVVFTGIAANGTYAGEGRPLADGTSATWNGSAAK